jgi:hypothetical protein
MVDSNPKVARDLDEIQSYVMPWDSAAAGEGFLGKPGFEVFVRVWRLMLS